MDYGDITGSFSPIPCMLYFGGLLQMNSFDKLPIKLFFLKRTLCLEYIWKHHASHHENQQPEKKRKNLELVLNNKLNMFCFWIKNRGKYRKMWRTRNEGNYFDRHNYIHIRPEYLFCYTYRYGIYYGYFRELIWSTNN